MIKVEQYLFKWGSSSENAIKMLQRFLKNDFDINWVKNAKVVKTNDKKIRVYTEEKSLDIIIDESKEKAILKIGDGRTYEIQVKEENGEFFLVESRVSQGDIYQNVEFIESVNEENGIVEISKIVFPYIVVLTQDCDLAQDFKFRSDDSRTGDKIILSVLVAPIYNANHVYLGEHLAELNQVMRQIQVKGKGNKPTTEWRNLVNNDNPRYHHLEFPNEVSIVPSIIDFKHYFSLNLEYLYEIRGKNFICKVSELYREDISQRFASFLSRIGLP
jgi:hypothetical protein